MKKDKNFPETPDIADIPAGHKTEHDKNAFDMINAYGTYEIQPPADTDNQYPAIAQGFNPKIIKTDRQNKNYPGDSFEKSKSDTKT